MPAPHSQVVLVLERSQSGGNVGRTCRAMANHGFAELRLVAPWYRDEEDAVRQSVHALPLYQAARRFPDLESALADRELVIGTCEPGVRTLPTRRLRAGARALAQQLAGSAPPRVALLFGSERWGLSNLALQRCHAVFSIPTGDRYSSLNLGSAVQVVLYELAECLAEAKSGDPPVAGLPEAPALPGAGISQAELDRCLYHVGNLAEETAFVTNLRARRRLLGRLRGVLQGRGSSRDVGLLTSLAGRVSRHLWHRSAAAGLEPRWFSRLPAPDADRA